MTCIDAYLTKEKTMSYISYIYLYIYSTGNYSSMQCTFLAFIVVDVIVRAMNMVV